MAHYSPRGFMRQASNELLHRYFDAKGFDLGLAWDELAETKVEPIYAAWLALPEQARSATDADFADINRLANDAGLQLLIQEGGWHELDLAAEFAAFEDQTDAVLWTFLEERRVFEVASLFYTADSIASRSWHKWKGLGSGSPKDDASGLAALETALANYFMQTQGRGRYCKVEVYQRSGSYYFFAFPADYARADQDFNESGELVRRTHRPVFQIVFVFSPRDGSLDIAAPGGKAVVEKLMNIAVSTLLKADRPDSGNDDGVYDLDCLRDPRLPWRYPATAGISAVWLKSFRLSFRNGRDKMVLEGDANGRVHELYGRIVGTADKPRSIFPESVYVTQATIRVEYAPQGGRKVSPKDFRLTWPNKCSLGQDAKDRVLRDMLIASGVDPQAIGRDEMR